MIDSIEQLRDTIRLTDDPDEKYRLLVDLVARLHEREESANEMEAANEILALAEQLGNLFYRAFGLRVLSAAQVAQGSYAIGLATEWEALNLYRQLGDPRGEATVLLNIGITYLYLYDLPRALEYLQQSLEIAQKLSQLSTIANAFSSMAAIYTILGDLQRSLELKFQALAIFEEKNDQGWIAIMLHNIGITYRELLEFDEAETYLKRALGIQREIDYPLKEGYTLSNLSDLYRNWNKPEMALECAQQALAIANRLQDDAAIESMLGEIGRIYQMIGHYDTALDYLTRALAFSQRREAKFEQFMSLWGIGTVEVERGRHTEGIALLHEALMICQEIGARSREWKVHENLAEAHQKQGDIAAAYNHYKLYFEIKEEVTGQEQQKAIDNLRTRHEIEAAQKEREIVRLENEKLQGELHHQENELTLMALHLVQKNEVLEKLKDEVVQMVDAATADAKPLLKKLVPMIQESIGAEQEWTTFEQQFVEVHPDFTEGLLSCAPELSPTELRIASLLRINMNTKEIASLLNVTNRAVEKHRLNLRKKLRISGEVNLPTYLASL